MITQEEKKYVVDRFVSMVEDNFNRKEIQKQKTIELATVKARELCMWSGFGDGIGTISATASPEGVKVIADEREGKIKWKEFAEQIWQNDA